LFVILVLSCPYSGNVVVLDYKWHNTCTNLMKVGIKLLKHQRRTTAMIHYNSNTTLTHSTCSYDYVLPSWDVLWYCCSV